MRQLIPLFLSVNTVVVMWLAGSKKALGWALGLLGQAMWLLFVVVFEAWGLLPLVIALTVVYGRNLRAWRAEDPDHGLIDWERANRGQWLAGLANRPPQWSVIVTVPLSVPWNLREQLFTAVADAAYDWEPEDRDWDIEVHGAPTDEVTS